MARFTAAAVLLLVSAGCPTVPDVGGSPTDEEAIWRTWLAWQAVRSRQMALRDMTIVRSFSGRYDPFDGAIQFAEREEKRPEPGEKATREAMSELERRLRALVHTALLPAKQYDGLHESCDSCGWGPFRRDHPGLDGAVAVSRVAFFRSFAMFYAEESTCGSASGSLVLLKFIEGRWTVAGTAGGGIACGECPDG